jgi:hypothetical protein
MKTESKEPAAENLGRNPYLPVSLEERAKEKARIREQQEKDNDRLLDCLDPAEAKRYEDRKPLYEWKVSVRLFRPAEGRKPAHMETIEKQVVAQNDKDAWAMFCDAIGEWPSRRRAKPNIERMKRRTLRDSSNEPEGQP